MARRMICCAAVAVLMAASTLAAEKRPERKPKLSVEEALRRSVSLAFDQTPLDTVVAYLNDTVGVPVVLDRSAIEDVGIAADAPVSVQLEQVSLRSALYWVLNEFDLTFTAREEMIVVTTPEAAEMTLTTKVYPVDGLISSDAEGEQVAAELMRLKEMVTTMVAPCSWQRVGGPCGIDVAEMPGVRALVVTQGWENHDTVAALLTGLDNLARDVAQEQRTKPLLLGAGVPRTAAEKAIYQALKKPVAFEFVDTPLADVIDHVRAASGVNVLLDRRSLDDVDMNADTPVTMSVANVPLDKALRDVLQPLDLTYFVWADVLVISTIEEWERALTLGIYPIADLIDGDAPKTRRTVARALAAMVTQMIDPTAWEHVGGPGQAIATRVADIDVLIISQVRESHDEIIALLDALRQVAARAEKDKSTEPILLEDGVVETNPKNAAIRAALEEKTIFKFIEVPLVDVMDYVAEKHGIDVQLDHQCLDDVGLAADTPITRSLRGVSLRSALRLTLRDLALTYVIHDGVLLITTPEEAETMTFAAVYPVTDLADLSVRQPPPWAEQEVSAAPSPFPRTILAQFYDGGFDGGLADPEYPRFNEVWHVHETALLRDALISCVQRRSWADVGGPGRMAGISLRGSYYLVIDHTHEAHEEIASLLAAIRAAERRIGSPDELKPILLYDREFQEKPPANAIRAALAKEVDFDFDEVPLHDVLEYVSEVYDVPCQLDHRAVDDVGLASDVPVTIHVSGISLRSALQLILRDLDLTWTIRDEVLFVTTPEAAEEQQLIGIHPAADVAAVYVEGDGPAGDDWYSLSCLITGNVQPTSWDTNTQVLSHGPFGHAKLFVFPQTLEVHDEIALLLAGLREANRRVGGPNEFDPTTPHADGLGKENPADAIREALAKEASFNFVDARLPDVAEFISDAYEIPCLIDRRALSDVGSFDNWPCTIHVSGVTLRAALELLLARENLTWVIWDEVLLITTPEEADTILWPAVYPVGDLVACRDAEDQLWYDLDPLIDLLTKSVTWESWDTVGGSGSISPFTTGPAMVLVVTQTGAVHERVAELLADLRAVAARAGDDARPPRRSRGRPRGGGRDLRRIDGGVTDPPPGGGMF